MKNFTSKLILLFVIGLMIPQLGFSQDNDSFKLSFEVDRVSPKLSISKQKLDSAERLIDLNNRYKSEWVRDYTSVEITTTHDGALVKAVSSTDKLTKEQLDLMKKADVHTDIAVKVKYTPENNLSQNDIKEMKFSFVIDPENEATFLGGEKQLKKYLQSTVIDKVSRSNFEIYNLTAVKFGIDEEGEVFDTEVLESSKDEKVDAILLDAICNMPTWSPAKYGNGTKVKREFVFTVGDHRSCTINLLDIVAIEKYRLEEEK